MKVQIINGPNLNLLGSREPDIYGQTAFDTFFNDLQSQYPTVELSYYLSNIEGELIILNAGAYTHTSIALLDCIRSLTTPVVEVHISNVHAREEFRHKSMISSACRGVIMGFGLNSYRLALEGIVG